MVIAVNVRYLIKGRLEGIGRFTFETLKHLTRKHKEHVFLFMFDRAYDPEFIFSDNIIPIVLSPPARHPFLWLVYFEFSIPNALKKYKADVYLSMDGWMSLRANIRSVQVLHDLHYEEYPQFLPLITRFYYKVLFPKFVNKASRIITVSNFCKKSIVETYNINEDRIDVAYNSVRNGFVLLSESEKESVKSKYTGGVDYFLIIGPIHPRKNIDNSIKAFLKFKSLTGSEIKLVITGKTLWKRFGNLDSGILKGFEKDVILTGYISDNELFDLTGAAKSLIYVSFYEGFGMPILEAMSCGVPVITSNISAMPEVAGDAAVFADPDSIDSIYNALTSVMNSSELTDRVVRNGFDNLKRFSWELSAEIIFKSLMS